MKPSLHRAAFLLLAGAALLAGCASTPSASRQLSLKPGTPWRDVAKAGGAATVKFSYVLDGGKYDLVTLADSPNLVVFKNSRLLAVLPPDAMSGWDRRVAEHLKTVDLPFENGVGQFHSWMLAQSRARPATPKPAKSSTAGDVAEAAAAGAILTPIAPILLAGEMVGASGYAMTGGERHRAQAVNESLLSCTGGYGSFLGQFDRPDFQTAKGSYQIREYLANRGSFLTGRDFFYEVGFRNGKPLWVTYENDAVRLHAVRYWTAHH